MRIRIALIIGAFVVACPLIIACRAIASPESIEQKSYSQALKYLLSARYHEHNYSEAIFDDSLRALALSSKSEADQHLINLFLFGLDASAAESHSCAVSHRLATNKNRFLKKAQISLKQFDTDNACQKFNAQQPLRSQVYGCVDKASFERWLALWSDWSIETDSGEADCSYLLAPRSSETNKNKGAGVK